MHHTSTHDVALVRIQNAGLKRAARGSLNIQDAEIRHLRTIAQLYRAGLYLCSKASVDNRKKKLVKQQYLLRHKASHNMVNVGSQLRSVGESGARQQIATGFESWFRYCTNVAQRRGGQPNFARCLALWRYPMGCYAMYTF